MLKQKYSVKLVQWEYEDQLPENISAEDFDFMFRASKVDGVRLYPYVICDGNRIYLGSSKPGRVFQKPDERESLGFVFKK